MIADWLHKDWLHKDRLAAQKFKLTFCSIQTKIQKIFKKIVALLLLKLFLNEFLESKPNKI
jgi:hypothetical protein